MYLVIMVNDYLYNLAYVIILMRNGFGKDPSTIGRFIRSSQSFSFQKDQSLLSKDISINLPRFTSNSRNHNGNYGRQGLSFQGDLQLMRHRWLQESNKELPEVKGYNNQVEFQRKIIKVNPQKQFLESKLLINSKPRRSTFHSRHMELIGRIYGSQQKSNKGQSAGKKIHLWKVSKGKAKQTKRPKQEMYNQGQKIPKEKDRHRGSRIIKEVNDKMNQSKRENMPLSKDKIDKGRKIVKRDVITSEHCTQSRMTQIGQQVNSDLKYAMSSNNFIKQGIQKMYLSNQRQNGFVFTSFKSQEERQKQIKAIMVETNGLQITRDSTIQSVFYLQGMQKKSLVELSMQTTLTELKILLLQSQQLQISFKFSSTLLNSIQNEGSQKIHKHVQDIFNSTGRNTQGMMLSFKKFYNCILVSIPTIHSKALQNCSDKKIALLWDYSGYFYFGGWINKKDKGFRCGLGLEYHPKCYMYYGQFKNNIRQGYGIMKKATKEVYLGQWLDNSKHGWGKIFNSSGEMLVNGYFSKGIYTHSRIKIE